MCHPGVEKYNIPLFEESPTPLFPPKNNDGSPVVPFGIPTDCVILVKFVSVCEYRRKTTTRTITITNNVIISIIVFIIFHQRKTTITSTNGK